GVEAEALMTRAVVARSEGAIKRAHDDLTRALSISRALEMRLFEAQALVALGSVLATTPGKQSQASEYRERGLALCQGMGVEPWWPRMSRPPAAAVESSTSLRQPRGPLRQLHALRTPSFPTPVIWPAPCPSPRRL